MEKETFVFIGDRGMLPDRTVRFGDTLEADEVGHFPAIPSSAFRPGMKPEEARAVRVETAIATHSETPVEPAPEFIQEKE